MKVKRQVFAKKHVTRTLAQWRRVLYSDLFSTCSSTHPIAMFGVQLENVLTSGTLQTMESPPSVMVWSSQGPGYKLTPTYQKLADYIKNLNICAYGVTILLEYLLVNNIINKNN